MTAELTHQTAEQAATKFDEGHLILKWLWVIGMTKSYI
jgi:hypothetical protein